MMLSSPFLRSSLLVLASLGACLGAQAATVLNNGDFETWPTTTTPTGWTRANNVTATQVTGLDGSGSAVLLGLSSVSASASLTQTTSTTIGPSAAFAFSMDFSQGASAGRNMNATLREGTGQTILNFAVIDGQLNTYAVGTSTFNPISSVVLSIDTAYRLMVSGNLGVGGRYDVQLYALSDLSTPLISVTNQNRWQFTPTAATTINSVNLERGRSAGDWTADNVSLIPEPTSALLMGIGALGFVARRRR